MSKPSLRVLLADTYDPYFNLASEDFIFKDMNPESKVLFIWRNANTIVIGRGQNAWSECDIAKIRQDKVNLARRHSGGGAVFQDLGNTCFTFMSARRPATSTKELYAINNQIILASLQRLGVSAQASGRNDIVLKQGDDYFKVSGSAFKESPDRLFHHGTMLLNVDLSKLSNYLTPNQLKLKAKGIKSVQSRVINLSQVVQSISHDSFQQALIEAFFSFYGSKCPIETLNHSSLAEIPSLFSYYETLRSWNWIYGKTPAFSQVLHERFAWGTLELHLDAEKGHILDAKAFSDSLEPDFIEAIPKYLSGIPYTPEGVSIAREKHQKESPNHQAMACDFYDWLAREL